MTSSHPELPATPINLSWFFLDTYIKLLRKQTAQKPTKKSDCFSQKRGRREIRSYHSTWIPEEAFSTWEHTDACKERSSGHVRARWVMTYEQLAILFAASPFNRKSSAPCAVLNIPLVWVTSVCPGVDCFGGWFHRWVHNLLRQSKHWGWHLLHSQPWFARGIFHLAEGRSHNVSYLSEDVASWLCRLIG